MALDTATLVSSVALTTEDTLVAELTVQTRKTHSEMLVPHIKEILSMAGAKKTDLEAIAVSVGPGSFTGLRIGLATAKALAYALHIPLVGVSTLAALAANCPVPGVKLVPLLDAQQRNVYQALYTWRDGRLIEQQPAVVRPLTAVLADFDGRDCPVLMFGEAAVMYREEISGAGRNLSVAPPHMIMPRAASVAAVGRQLLRQGICQDAFTLEPLYIRRPAAEVLWEKRNGDHR